MQRSLSDFFTPALAARCGADLPRLEPYRGNPAVTSLVYDSRAVLPGSLYFALKGLHVDGHSFIRDAVARGASVVVHQDPLDRSYPDIVSIKVRDSRFAMSPIADAFWDSPSRSLATIGVTGTEGKSTTVFLIYQLLELAGARAGFVSTVQYRTGDTEEWNPEHQTTPEAPTVHAALAAMRDHGMEYAVIESSSHGLSPLTNRLGDVAFDVGVMTNVTHEHLEFHGTWERYRDDKANLFRALDRYDHMKTIGGAQRKIPSFAVANADDPSAAYFAAATAQRTFTFSVGRASNPTDAAAAPAATAADLTLKDLASDAAGNSYRAAVRDTGAVLALRDNLPGAFNPKNVMAALLTVSGLLGVPVADLAPLVTKLRPVRGRMNPIDRGQPFEVIVDYAHTPSSFETVLPPIKRRISAGGGRVISLFGSGGERDREKRPRQGRIAADWSDIVILADEDPRGEDPMALLEEIAGGCPEKARGSELFLIPDRPTAIRKAFSLARPKDAVLLLGKGHENSIIYKDRTISFDEIGEAEKALAELGYGARP